MSVVKRFMRKVALFRARSFPSSLEYTLPFALEQGMRKTATVKKSKHAQNKPEVQPWYLRKSNAAYAKMQRHERDAMNSNEI
jgi:hypothetical protein